MTDKELLELAAKAAGIEIRGPATKFIASGVTDLDLVIRNDRGGDSVWNPLTDDGDALRLAVELELIVSLDFNSDERTVSKWSRETYSMQFCIYEPTGNDSCAATRRAIVRAAAEIGKTL
jgi:hypothetical protein